MVSQLLKQKDFYRIIDTEENCLEYLKHKGLLFANPPELCEKFRNIIHSDQWKAYQCLIRNGYLHETVNHSVEFVSSAGTHTQTIETLWGDMPFQFL